VATPLPFDPIDEARRQWREHGWAEAADGMAAVTSVMRAEQIFLAHVDELLKPFGLTFARYEALMLLVFSRQGSLPLSKIGERLQVHPSSVTNTIDRLETHGLVRRQRHPTDRRATLAQITTEGKKVAKQATTVLNRDMFRSSGLSTRDSRELFRLLQKLRAAEGDFA
jgi:DNA-binding MarR family transcriptional regulator